MGNLQVRQAVKLHFRDEVVHDAPGFSEQDIRFLLKLPLLALAAVAWSPTGGQKFASLINKSIGKLDKFPALSQLSSKIADRLGTSEMELRNAITDSSVGDTENLIIVIRSLLLRKWRPKYSVSGKHHLDEAIADGKGVVLWVAHFSFASLITKMALDREGYGVIHTSRPEHGVSKSRFGIRYLNWVRVWAEDRYLAERIIHRRNHPGETKQAALAALRGNGLLSITVGAWEGRHVATGELLGAKFTVSAGAPAFAYFSGAKLLPVFTTRNDDGDSYNVMIGAPLGEGARSSLDDYITASTLELFAEHEARIREAPNQWRSWNKLKE